MAGAIGMKRGRRDITVAESDDMATTALGGHVVASDVSEEARKDRPHSKLWMERTGAFECSEDEQISEDMVLKGKKYYSNGNRGVVYIATCVMKGGEVKVAVKEILHEKHIKPGRCYIGEEALEKEAGWLQRANEHGIGPRFLYGDSRKVIMEFVEGKRILAFITEEHDEERCKKALCEVLTQLRKLDSLHIHKGEFVRPDRHILIRDDGTPVLIDFERCKESSTPQNITQFVQFLAGIKLDAALHSNGKNVKINGERLRELSRDYKSQGYREQEFELMLNLIRNS
ncbi:hypothetical protein GUITHDRAFT_109925 [Guillardia theta CCMP2712]|uniref:Protein kinase domain-containing protein n=1 Tax=Guillardia theta (strain CCMP2712) TaxID=905079 RepID=L1J718_GUITC|nr:hypothetical protein GUITHDRAFT_109925 [Guillardia theta CCMP2712]EKX44142.1 hypothetical protein GUITHDRAFT_109925 [Guillardia theta CCMP2712]|eukprot:XP_005831122.1 hypothetical protein GUITHDRAFT_109925 [Guillardia theta CCMP2712]